MTGYVMVFGSCAVCDGFISFNPSCVPSIVVNGEKEPICRSCFDRWNKIHRTDKGLEPVELDPQAYEPQAEFDLEDR